MGGEFTYQPKWDPKTVVTHGHMVRIKPGTKMVDPEPCKESRRRPQLFMVGIVPSSTRVLIVAHMLLRRWRLRTACRSPNPIAAFFPRRRRAKPRHTPRCHGGCQNACPWPAPAACKTSDAETHSPPSNKKKQKRKQGKRPKRESANFHLERVDSPTAMSFPGRPTFQVWTGDSQADEHRSDCSGENANPGPILSGLPSFRNKKVNQASWLALAV